MFPLPGLERPGPISETVNRRINVMGSELGFGLHGLGMVAFWVLIVLLMFYIVRGVIGENGKSDGKSAVEILNERFASGEIEQDEYEEKKRALT
jgi:putative membrane protein